MYVTCGASGGVPPHARPAVSPDEQVREVHKPYYQAERRPENTDQDQGTQKDVGDAHDKYLPPDGANPHGFTPEQQKVMVKAFQDRLAEVRSK